MVKGKMLHFLPGLLRYLVLVVIYTRIPQTARYLITLIRLWPDFRLPASATVLRQTCITNVKFLNRFILELSPKVRWDRQDYCGSSALACILLPRRAACGNLVLALA